MMALITITLFSFTENTEFSSSTLYSLIEMVTILSIIGAAGADFLVVLVDLYEEIKSWCRKSKKVNVEKAKIEKEEIVRKRGSPSQQNPFKIPTKNHQSEQKKSKRQKNKQRDQIFSTDHFSLNFDLEQDFQVERRIQKSKQGILSRQGVPKTTKVRYNERDVTESQIQIKRHKTGFLGSRSRR